jgi:hypothetical protein
VDDRSYVLFVSHVENFAHRKPETIGRFLA